MNLNDLIAAMGPQLLGSQGVVGQGLQQQAQQLNAAGATPPPQPPMPAPPPDPSAPPGGGMLGGPPTQGPAPAQMPTFFQPNEPSTMNAEQLDAFKRAHGIPLHPPSIIDQIKGLLGNTSK